MEFGLALTAEVTISQQSEKNSKNIKNYRGEGLLFSCTFVTSQRGLPCATEPSAGARIKGA